MKILLLTPPLVQLNTPYPATPTLTGFLQSRGYAVEQADLGLELVLRLFSRAGLSEAIAVMRDRPKAELSPSVQQVLDNEAAYLETVDSVRRFLQGKDSSLAYRIIGRNFLPEGARFSPIEDFGDEGLDWAFGGLGFQDQAKYLASLYIDDLADAVREGVDPRFELSKYGEKLAASQASFDSLAEALASPPSLMDRWIEELTLAQLDAVEPTIVGLSVPFPGNVYGAFRIAQAIRRHRPGCRILLGGGYVNTELRSLTETEVFKYIDYITFDDGEKPILCLLEHLAGQRPESELLRTMLLSRDNDECVVKFVSSPREHDLPFRGGARPTYRGLRLGEYLSLFEMLNPMHRIWSDGRWNKLTLAHGCYWKKCNFCDVTLDYIGRYEPAGVDEIVDRMEKLIAETGQSGFHFVDEAAPPALLKALAERLIERGVQATWWGNVRFEKSFTPELCELLARAGFIAATGGLEVASDRLLKLMNKGVTIEQVARVTRAMTDAGILVHAYLMFGFPTQTVQETVDSLENVRQLFAAGCLQSAFWHRFSATIHSPIGKNPDAFGINLLPRPLVTFAENDLPFADPTPCDHDRLGIGLKRALYNFMLGAGLEADVRSWFDGKVPATKIPPERISEALG